MSSGDLWNWMLLLFHLIGCQYINFLPGIVLIKLTFQFLDYATCSNIRWFLWERIWYNWESYWQAKSDITTRESYSTFSTTTHNERKIAHSALSSGIYDTSRTGLPFRVFHQPRTGKQIFNYKLRIFYDIWFSVENVCSNASWKWYQQNYLKPLPTFLLHTGHKL